MPNAAEKNEKVNETALDIIEGAPEQLRLNPQEWDQVRDLIKEGVRRGMEIY